MTIADFIPLRSMSKCPVTKDIELYDGLELPSENYRFISRKSSEKSGPKDQYLPGHPRTRLDMHSPEIGDFLETELFTPDLNTLSPRLWLLATPDSSHISSLTHQIVKNRKIIVTEKPELHLVWYYDRIFVKPLPKFLLSNAFWEFYLYSSSSPSEATQKHLLIQAATGFIRSYAHLIRHKSDFDVATRTQDGQRLIPKKVKFGALIKFLSAFERLEDSEVSPRFHYGELRLSRLNFWTKIFLGRSAYHRVHGQYADRVARTYGPLLFVFAILSVLMASFQVALAVPEVLELKSNWRALGKAAQGVSTMTLLLVALAALYPLVMVVFLIGREIRFALVQQLEKRRSSS